MVAFPRPSPKNRTPLKVWAVPCCTISRLRRFRFSPVCLVCTLRYFLLKSTAVASLRLVFESFLQRVQTAGIRRSRLRELLAMPKRVRCTESHEEEGRHHTSSQRRAISSLLQGRKFIQTITGRVAFSCLQVHISSHLDTPGILPRRTLQAIDLISHCAQHHVALGANHSTHLLYLYGTQAQ